MKREEKTLALTLSAILAGLGLIFLYLSALIPSGRWSMVAVAGLLPAAAVISIGLWGGVATYAVTGLLGFFLVPSQINVLLYLLFFGIYPVVKSLLERLDNPWLTLLGKLAFFNAILTVFCLGLSALFLPALPTWLLGKRWFLYLVGNVVFLAYDYGFTKLIGFYMARVHKKLKR